MIQFDRTASRMLVEHVGGDGYRAIGRRHAMSHEYARQLVIQEGTRFIDSVEMDLYLAAKLERMGRVAEAEWPTFVVAHQAQEDWQSALSLLQWTVSRLKARDVHVHVRNRPTPEGSVFELTWKERHDPNRPAARAPRRDPRALPDRSAVTRQG